MFGRVLCCSPILFSVCLALLLAACSPQEEQQSESPFPLLSGPYLGQQPPGSDPELFAPGIVSTGMYERDVTISPDGNELYFSITTSAFLFSTIMVTKQVDGRWTEPEVAPFSGHPEWKDLEPCIAPDGRRLFFLSTRPVHPDSSAGDEDIWVIDRGDGGWGDPVNLGDPVNSEHGEFFPSVTRDGTLYFTRDDRETGTSTIFRSRLVDGDYTDPERLPDLVNGTAAQFNAYVAPDESYLIYCVYGREDTIGSTDYYICFRSLNDVWTAPINLGERINTSGGVEYSPYVSLDGKYLFFMASRMADLRETVPDRLTREDLTRMHSEPQNGNADIYWIDAGFIDGLRPE